ncbi:hypothetical protein A8B79_04840 [Balneola sp. EhC07]|nr:hypothetical protein A8B79_04840 [Balneola sp. EhC07]
MVVSVYLLLYISQYFFIVNILFVRYEYQIRSFVLQFDWLVESEIYQNITFSIVMLSLLLFLLYINNRIVDLFIFLFRKGFR